MVSQSHVREMKCTQTDIIAEEVGFGVVNQKQQESSEAKEQSDLEEGQFDPANEESVSEITTVPAQEAVKEQIANDQEMENTLPFGSIYKQSPLEKQSEEVVEELMKAVEDMEEEANESAAEQTPES